MNRQPQLLGDLLPGFITELANRHHTNGAPPMKFRKKPVVIEAMQLTSDNVRDVQAWCNTNGTNVTVQWHPLGSTPEAGREGWLVLTTIHGDEAIARPGDWVVPEPVAGRFYPVKPDIFEATYEPVDGAA